MHLHNPCPHRNHDRRCDAFGRLLLHPVASATMCCLALEPEPPPGLLVGITNCHRVPSTCICKQVPMTIGVEQFFINLYVLLIDDYEFVLDCQWLKTLGPILWDFERHLMAFRHGDYYINWTSTPLAPQLHAMECLDLLSLLLAEFLDLFANPMRLSPR